MDTPPDNPHPSFIQSLICFAGVIGILSAGLFVFEISIHALLFCVLCWVAGNARVAGCGYTQIRQMMSAGIADALPAIFIFFLIGMVIASYMLSGTVATLMVVGMDWLTPGSFLLAGFVLASMMSLATGTSWGTVGTVGVVLMGIGEAMGVSLPLVAGVVISGATFGDKLSPVSDTTNLAAMSSGTDLFAHIRSMLFTTLPTFVLVVLILLLISPTGGSGTLPAQPAEVRAALVENFEIGWVVGLLPILVMLGMSMRRFAPEVCMTASTLTAMVLAVIYQQRTIAEVLNGLWQNQPGNTGLASVDALLGRGGMASMSWTLMLALLALALGGILLRGGFLRVLLEGLTGRVKRTRTLIASTITAGFLGNVSLGEAYVSIILASQAFRSAYDRAQISRAVLSRSVEEGATMTTGLIPWTTAGAFYAATLGVPTLEYAPYAFLNYLNPLVSIVMATLGIGLLGSRRAQDQQ